MVEFITLFLGLVAGPQQVEVMVSERVATVELQLDGASVASLRGQPWTAQVDFGESLRVRELAAIAFDAGGAELARASQLINRPRPDAEARLLLERDSEGRAVAARLEWQSNVEDRPVAATVSLDGVTLPIDRLERFLLPEHAPDRFHVLQADLYFSRGVSAHAEVTFGGIHLDETRGELTALLVRPSGQKRMPSTERLRGLLTARGGSLSVVAVEKGPAEVILVRGVGVRSSLLTFKRPVMGGGPYGIPAQVGYEQMKSSLQLPSDHRLRVILPRAASVSRGHLELDTFILSPDLSTRHWGVFWALSQQLLGPGTSPQIRVADAVAVAGLQAARGNRRRAVVLVTQKRWTEASNLRSSVVVDYLRDLDVPLYVWHLGERPVGSGWPAATPITDYPELRKAFRELERDLGRQRVVWLDGSHAQESIVFADEAGVERLGSRRQSD